jgi:IS5 family transposase
MLSREVGIVVTHLEHIANDFCLLTDSAFRDTEMLTYGIGGDVGLSCFIKEEVDAADGVNDGSGPNFDSTRQEWDRTLSSHFLDELLTKRFVLLINMCSTKFTGQLDEVDVRFLQLGIVNHYWISYSIRPFNGKDGKTMSLCLDGLNAKLEDTLVSTAVFSSVPLIVLANALNWEWIAALAMNDLKRTAKGFWQVGRRLLLRLHLAVMILQCLLKETDRGIEKRIQETPVLQVFCGYGILPKWRCPDHTKIEDFRNRLSPETQKAIGHYVLQIAAQYGFADAAWMDVDSTVQEANIAYPSDATLMKKLAEKSHRVLSFLREKAKTYLPKGLSIDIEQIRKKAQSYFFLSKNAPIEERRALFKDYHQLVKRELRGVIDFFKAVNIRKLRALPWNIHRTLTSVAEQGWRYLLDVGHFVRTHTIKAGKRLSFHAADVACIKKGKIGKPHEFGRVFQLGRIGGNFLVAFSATSVRMEDKHSLLPAIQEHQRIFGKEVLKEVGADKGYYSNRNVKAVEALSINADGLQRPSSVKASPPPEQVQPRRNRRAGIEPLIQHAKSFGLGKSKMKSDETTLASGYRAVMGFNLHQLLRHMAAPAG